MIDDKYFNPIDLKVLDAVKKLREKGFATSDQEIASKSGLKEIIFSQLRQQRGHIKTTDILGMIEAFGLNPAFFFMNDAPLFQHEVKNNFESHDESVQINQNQGSIGNVVGTVNGDFTTTNAEKIIHSLPPECRHRQCASIIKDLRSGILFFKKEAAENKQHAIEALEDAKKTDAALHKLTNRYVTLTDKYTTLLEKQEQ